MIRKLISLLTLSTVAGPLMFQPPARSQYSTDPGVAMGQNVCLLVEREGIPWETAMRIGATPMLGLQASSQVKAQAARNYRIIASYVRQNSQNGEFNEAAKQKLISSFTRYMLNDCPNAF